MLRGFFILRRPFAQTALEGCSGLGGLLFEFGRALSLALLFFGRDRCGHARGDDERHADQCRGGGGFVEKHEADHRRNGNRAEAQAGREQHVAVGVGLCRADLSERGAQPHAEDAEHGRLARHMHAVLKNERAREPEERSEDGEVKNDSPGRFA